MRWINRSLDGAREYRSQDGQWYIFNPTPWRTMGGYKNWHLYRADTDTHAGSYATMREAKQAAQQRQESKQL